MMPPDAQLAAHTSSCSSKMGIVGTHPAVFARVANKEVAGYGTWKSVRKTGGRDRANGARTEKKYLV